MHVFDWVHVFARIPHRHSPHFVFVFRLSLLEAKIGGGSRQADRAGRPVSGLRHEDVPEARFALISLIARTNH